MRIESDRSVEIFVNGVATSVPAGITVAAALMNLGMMSTRRSVTDAGRIAMCGMGVCYECRVTIDDVSHRRGCMTRVAAGMAIVTVPERKDDSRA
jgi:predicted molibdopterin-dependent oxidoreductase YjgC